MAVMSKEAAIPPWGLAVAGATGAVLANAMVYPLDMCVPYHSPSLPSPIFYRLSLFSYNENVTNESTVSRHASKYSRNENPPRQLL
jgi:hypothetical protein